MQQQKESARFADASDWERQVTDAVGKSIAMARDYFNELIVVPEVRFDLKGRSAGQARFVEERVLGVTTRSRPVIRFNRQLMEQNPQAFIDDVAPHETAHVIAHALFGSQIKPHGREWKMIMSQVLKREPTVTHNFDVSSVPSKRFHYRCDCAQLDHKLSTIRHNRVQRKQAIYRCRQCSTSLRYVG